MLVNVREMTGFDPPSVQDRFWFMRKFVDDAGGMLVIALVVRSEQMDPQKFGIMVANNRGLTSEAFLAEPEALRWLMGARSSKAG